MIVITKDSMPDLHRQVMARDNGQLNSSVYYTKATIYALLYNYKEKDVEESMVRWMAKQPDRYSFLIGEVNEDFSWNA